MTDRIAGYFLRLTIFCAVAATVSAIIVGVTLL